LPSQSVKNGKITDTEKKTDSKKIGRGGGENTPGTGMLLKDPDESKWPKEPGVKLSHRRLKTGRLRKSSGTKKTRQKRDARLGQRGMPLDWGKKKQSPTSPRGVDGQRAEGDGGSSVTPPGLGCGKNRGSEKGKISVAKTWENEELQERGEP